MQKTYNVCIVCARKDAEYLKELWVHLLPMLHAGFLKVWCNCEANGMKKILQYAKVLWIKMMNQYTLYKIYTPKSSVE
jgi:hypothetical protein